MSKPIKGFVGPAYMSISRSINAQRCVNLRLELDSANGKVPVALVGLPGYRTLITDFPAEPVRGFWKAQARVFVAVGTRLYELFADWTHVEIGELNTQSTPVSMADNGLQLIAVDGTGLLCLDLVTGEVAYSIQNFPYGSKFIAVVDNTFLAADPDSQRFQISAVGDGRIWRAIDTTSAEALPDNIATTVPFSRQFYVLGTDSMQLFWDSGDPERPFIPVEGGTHEIGCPAPYSACKDEAGVYWLGQDKRGGPRVYKAAGGQVAVISTPALDVEFKAYTLADAVGYTFRMDGHIFYVLTFPTDGRTWLYDAVTEGWHEFLEWTNSGWRRHRSSCAIHAFGKQLIGDFENGKLYELTPEAFDNAGAVLRAVRASAHVSQDQAQIVVGSVEVLMQSGVGLTLGQGADPSVMLRVSKDGGFTWTPEMRRPIGRKGDYARRARFNRPCGIARDVVIEVSITDPVPRVIVGGFLNVN